MYIVRCVHIAYDAIMGYIVYVVYIDVCLLCVLWILCSSRMFVCMLVYVVLS